MKPKKILLVSGFFPPYSPLGAVRPPALAAYWAARGHDVRVIAIRNPAIEGMLESPLPREHVCHVAYPPPGGLLDRAVGAVKRLGEGAGGPPQPGRPPRLGGLRRIYQQTIEFPDRYRTWVRPAVQAGMALARDWRPDLIYSSTPPHTGHIVAMRLSRALRVPWVAELRDLWADNAHDDVHPLVHPFRALLANAVTRRATAIVALTAHAARELGSSLGRPTIVSYNGYGREDFVGLETVPAHDPERLTIVHAGAIYGGRRDPGALFRALAVLGEERRRVRVQFYHNEPITAWSEAEQLGVQDCIETHRPLPRREILRLQRAVDVLLLCRWDDPAGDGIIPGKLFEYIGARRPILAIGSTTGEAVDIMRRHGFGIAERAPEAIAAQLRRWLAAKQAAGGRVPDLPAEPTCGFVREAQFEKVDALLARILRGEPVRAGGAPAGRRA